MDWTDQLHFGPFKPLEWIEGNLPIEDHGLIGDGMTGALVGRDGAIDWLCVPRFDAPPVFCRILDTQRGGAFIVAPESLQASRQSYLDETGILATEMRCPTGLVRVLDALTFHRGSILADDAQAARGELVRCVEVLEGTVRLRISIAPREQAHLHRDGESWQIWHPDRPEIILHLRADRPLDGPHTVFELKAGDRINLTLRWNGVEKDDRSTPPLQAIDDTIKAWKRWLGCLTYTGPQASLVRRSAITLKLMDNVENGAIVAAPTSSLPEQIGGVRNWDYRYAWIRDAAFSVYALRRIGVTQEARSFLAWVLEIIDRDGGRPRVLYTIDGRQPESEWEDPSLTGYRGSAPVRWGNDAANQRQHDVFGEIIDCAFQWVRLEGQISEGLWSRLLPLIESARTEWNEPDHGIWEIRSSGRPFTYSAALCQVALDRGAWIAERLNLPGDIDGWRTDAAHLRQTILEEAWDPEQNALTEHIGGKQRSGLDSSALTLPLRRVLRADHPRMVATTEAIRRTLDAGNGLLFRYHPERSPDGLPGEEGAFLLCSFWLVDNLTLQGRIDEALDLYNSLCARANSVGLLSEQIDPSSGRFLGNFPQAFSHVGVITSGVTLSRAIQAESRNLGQGT
ncbi:glycoside hydrolase family 15 protein [Tautonia rosea]|uniref:glycoside hydrolase family 15 protein n=1 Tax=Tautonia rosea TaxID=2728037 RepID=UPI0014763CFF|nr:glycoside hydrolase family 15 protein [Tautonia rosea]